ncbi:MAG: MBL fold metallo-hydrolase [Deltaproteobacteria bacterium]|nr:MAG: MBL fold metallo-hydrolase [Deltaproteobacteria bacterium]
MATSPPTIRLFGVGGAFSRKYGTTCALLTTASGSRWLVDCGRQAPDQLHRANLAWHEIDGQIVTHVHGDHVFGIEDFAFRRFYEGWGDVPSIRAGGPRPRLVAHSAVRAELWETLGPALRYVPDGDDPRGGTLAHYFDVLDPIAVEGPKHNGWNHAETFRAEDLTVRARECMHVPGKPSTSLELEIEPGVFAWWSGDSTVDGKWLTKIEPKTTIFFHDCTFVDYPGQVHGAFTLLAELPEKVRRKIVLMHHEDDIEDHRAEAEALGFRIAMPDDVFDLATGRKIG